MKIKSLLVVGGLIIAVTAAFVMKYATDEPPPVPQTTVEGQALDITAYTSDAEVQRYLVETPVQIKLRLTFLRGDVDPNMIARYKALKEAQRIQQEHPEVAKRAVDDFKARMVALDAKLKKNYDALKIKFLNQTQD